MKALVTGISGFVGRHLKKHLDVLGWEIYESNTRVGNLMDEKNLHIYNDIKFDYIIHLAAHTKAGDYCLYHQGEQFEINQTINTNILMYWRHHQPQAKMVAMGTSCSYNPKKVMIEENYFVGDPDESLYTYAMTKRMLLIGLQAYAKQFGLKYMYYVPSTLFGTEFDIEDSHFIFDLIKKIYEGKYKGSEVELWGDGHQLRELIYIDDAIKIMLDTLSMENEILNLGTGVEYSIRDYAELISDLIGYDPKKIVYNTDKFVGVRSKKLNTAKMFEILPKFEFTPIIEGIYNTIKYYDKKITDG